MTCLADTDIVNFVKICWSISYVTVCSRINYPVTVLLKFIKQN